MKYWFICEIVGLAGRRKIISKRYATDAEIQEIIECFPNSDALEVDEFVYKYMNVGDAW